MLNVTEDLKIYLRRNKIPNPLNVTLTQKQKYNEIWIDEIISSKNYKHFKNVLNKKVFGNSFRRFGKQLKMLIIREFSNNNRHHLHTIIEHPQSFQFDEFKDLIRTIWVKTDFGYKEIHIEKPSSQLREEGYLEYIMKDFGKSYFDNSVDWENTHLC